MKFLLDSVNALACLQVDFFTVDRFLSFSVPNYDMGKEKVSNKKVGWECSNTDEYLDGTVCKPICGPGSMPTGINNVCTCDKKGRCKWKGYIKDHCQRKLYLILEYKINHLSRFKY